MRRVEILIFNWHFDIDGNENFCKWEAGEDEVVKIEENECHVEGDKHWFDVFFKDGRKNRIFNPNEVIYEKEY